MVLSVSEGTSGFLVFLLTDSISPVVYLRSVHTVRLQLRFFAAINGLHWIQCESSHCCSCGNSAASKWVWNPFPLAAGKSR